MRNPILGGLAGAFAGVSAAAVPFLVARWPRHFSPGEILLYTALYAGPGAFFLGLPLTGALLHQFEGGAPRPRVLAHGALAGLVLGFVNLALLFLLVLGPGRMVRIFSATEPVNVVFFAAAASGGLGLGLGCAWWASRPEDASA